MIPAIGAPFEASLRAVAVIGLLKCHNKIWEAIDVLPHGGVKASALIMDRTCVHMQVFINP